MLKPDLLIYKPFRPKCKFYFRTYNLSVTIIVFFYVSEITTALCHASQYKPESSLTMLLLNHLLLRLTPNTKCSLDKDVSWIFKCPDKCKYDLHDLNLKTNDTSIGEYFFCYTPLHFRDFPPFLSRGQGPVNLGKIAIKPLKLGKLDERNFYGCHCYLQE